MITGKLYDYLKFLAQIVLPALATLYFALAGLWGLPAAEQVVGTIVAVDAFLGVVLGISQVNYNKNTLVGDMVVADHPEAGKTFQLQLNGDPEQLADQPEVRFKVKNQTKPRAKKRTKKNSSKVEPITSDPMTKGKS